MRARGLAPASPRLLLPAWHRSFPPPTAGREVIIATLDEERSSTVFRSFVSVHPRVYLCKGLPGSGDEVNTWYGGSGLALGGGQLHVDMPPATMGRMPTLLGPTAARPGTAELGAQAADRAQCLPPITVAPAPVALWGSPD